MNTQKLKRIMNSPISRLKIPKKLDYAFRQRPRGPAPDYKVIGELCFENEWLLKTKYRVGPKTIAVVKQRLAKLGLSLDMPYDQSIAFLPDPFPSESRWFEPTKTQFPKRNV
jgi:hypothetical protein